MSGREPGWSPLHGQRRVWLGQALRFGLVGASNTLLDLALFSALVWLKVNPVPANVVSYGLSIAWSYQLNRRWTFRGHTEAKAGKRALPTALRFVIVSLTGLMLSTILLRFLVAFAPPVLSKIATVPVIFAWGFVLSKLYVFASPPPSPRG